MPLVPITIVCVAGVRKGREREFGRETTRFLARPSRSLAPKIPFHKAPFPFPFKRLPRRLRSRRLRPGTVHGGLHGELTSA